MLIEIRRDRRLEELGSREREEIELVLDVGVKDRWGWRHRGGDGARGLWIPAWWLKMQVKFRAEDLALAETTTAQLLGRLQATRVVGGGDERWCGGDMAGLISASAMMRWWAWGQSMKHGAGWVLLEHRFDGDVARWGKRCDGGGCGLDWRLGRKLLVLGDGFEHGYDD